MTTCRKRSIHNSAVPSSAFLPSSPAALEAAGDQPLGGRIRLLRLAQVISLTGLGKTKIYDLQAEGSFPMRVQITAHAVGWVEEEVQAWLARRVAARAIPTAIAGAEMLKRLSR